ncbi:MAG TPA: hypothetical protein PK264_15905 [Hyphomicrobiaceae bacterium]|nr:hypothetical protein [Hyphomicrobiaceae bacterium]
MELAREIVASTLDADWQAMIAMCRAGDPQGRFMSPSSASLV